MDKQPSTWSSILFLLVFSGIFTSIGIIIFLVSTNVIVVPEGKINAPRWVLASAGSTFSLAGLMVLVNGLKEIIRGEKIILKWMVHLLSFLFMISLAIPFHWVAFGPGDREFTSSLGVGSITFSRQGGEIGGRIAFGFFAILMDILIIILIDRMLFGSSNDD